MLCIILIKLRCTLAISWVVEFLLYLLFWSVSRKVADGSALWLHCYWPVFVPVLVLYWFSWFVWFYILVWCGVLVLKQTFSSLVHVLYVYHYRLIYLCSSLELNFIDNFVSIISQVFIISDKHKVNVNFSLSQLHTAQCGAP